MIYPKFIIFGVRLLFILMGLWSLCKLPRFTLILWMFIFMSRMMGTIRVENGRGNVEFYAMSVVVFVGPLVVVYVCGIVFWLIELWTVM